MYHRGCVSRVKGTFRGNVVPSHTSVRQASNSPFIRTENSSCSLGVSLAGCRGYMGAWGQCCVNWDRRGHQQHSTLLLRRGKKPKILFGGLHLLPLRLTLILLQLLRKTREDDNSLLPQSSSPFNVRPIDYNDPPIYRDGETAIFPQTPSGYFLPSP
jgi:hypothetical protein